MYQEYSRIKGAVGNLSASAPTAYDKYYLCDSESDLANISSPLSGETAFCNAEKTWWRYTTNWVMQPSCVIGCLNGHTEFLSTNTVQHPFIGAAISSGTNNTAPASGVIDGQHPGVVLLRSSTTANSGYQYSTALNVFRLDGGEQFDVILRTPATFTNTTLRCGFLDSITVTAPVDGAYFECVGSGVLVGKCRNNSVESVSAMIVTLNANTWYHLRVRVISTTEVVFSVYDSNGALLGSVSITTNIPSAAGRETGCGLVVTNSGTTATDLINIDFMRVMSTNLIRGLI